MQLRVAPVSIKASLVEVRVRELSRSEHGEVKVKGLMNFQRGDWRLQLELRDLLRYHVGMSHWPQVMDL
jgi:hypothetical protein